MDHCEGKIREKIGKARNGEVSWPELAEDLQSIYKGRLLGFLKKRVSPEDADEIASDTILAFIERANENPSEIDSIAGFLLTVAKHKVIDRSRKASRRITTTGFRDGEYDTLEKTLIDTSIEAQVIELNFTNEVAARLWATLDKQREPLYARVLKVILEHLPWYLSNREIAEVLGQDGSDASAEDVKDARAYLKEKYRKFFEK